MNHHRIARLKDKTRADPSNENRKQAFASAIQAIEVRSAKQSSSGMRKVRFFRRDFLGEAMSLDEIHHLNGLTLFIASEMIGY